LQTLHRPGTTQRHWTLRDFGTSRQSAMPHPRCGRSAAHDGFIPHNTATSRGGPFISAVRDRSLPNDTPHVESLSPPPYLTPFIFILFLTFQALKCRVKPAKLTRVSRSHGRSLYRPPKGFDLIHAYIRRHNPAHEVRSKPHQFIPRFPSIRYSKGNVDHSGIFA
jgi:hypothetical protein